MKVDVYRNLHTGTLSVRHKGKVIKHPAVAVILAPRFVVQPAGRERVLREKRKNVHAFVRGELADMATEMSLDLRPLLLATYNPYKADYFYNKDTEAPVYEARYAFVSPTAILYAPKEQ
jgi:hypothetical protein